MHFVEGLREVYQRKLTTPRKLPVKGYSIYIVSYYNLPLPLVSPMRGPPYLPCPVHLPLNDLLYSRVICHEKSSWGINTACPCTEGFTSCWLSHLLPLHRSIQRRFVDWLYRSFKQGHFTPISGPASPPPQSKSKFLNSGLAIIMILSILKYTILKFY